MCQVVRRARHAVFGRRAGLLRTVELPFRNCHCGIVAFQDAVSCVASIRPPLESMNPVDPACQPLPSLFEL